MVLGVFVSSLLGSLHCAGMCGPLVAAYVGMPAAEAVTATLGETAEHDYAADVAVVRPGLWEFRVEAVRGTETFTAVVEQDAPGAVR